MDNQIEYAQHSASRCHDQSTAINQYIKEQ